VSATVQRGGVALGLGALVVGTWLCLQGASRLRATWPPEADNFYLPSSRTLRLLSLGHHELAADLVAARGNVYFGTQILGKGEQRWLAQYIDMATDLDPYFHRLYLSGAAMIVYNGKTISLEMVQAATTLLERGVATFPLDWEIKFQLGFNYFFELPKLVSADDPRVPHWRQRGVEALQQAALFEGIPDWLPNLVARMLTKTGSQEMAIRSLEQAYTVAATEEVRAQIRFKLVQLRGQQFYRQLEEEHQRFEALVKSRYPYAPDAFSVIAPRHARAIDLGLEDTPPPAQPGESQSKPSPPAQHGEIQRGAPQGPVPTP
jgi:hypothetical protein